MGIQQLENKIDFLTLSLAQQGVDIGKVRWFGAAPDAHLTWGSVVSGDAFIEKARENGVFGEDKSILEIGPGYGRLLSSIKQKGLPFDHYTGLDISQSNIDYLKSKFGNTQVEFIRGDAETIELQRNYDSLISSLTLKHLYPTFEKALLNVSKAMKANSVACFDLLERASGGSQSVVEDDAKTYRRYYSRAEVMAILRETSFSFVKFDYVKHMEGRVRLLVVARKA